MSKNCYAKGGGKEGQGPRQKAAKAVQAAKAAKTETAVVAIAENEKNKMFAFSCTSDYANVAEALQTSKSKLGSCVDSRASDMYSPNHKKFTNYRPIN